MATWSRVSERTSRLSMAALMVVSWHVGFCRVRQAERGRTDHIVYCIGASALRLTHPTNKAKNREPKAQRLPARGGPVIQGLDVQIPQPPTLKSFVLSPVFKVVFSLGALLSTSPMDSCQ